MAALFLFCCAAVALVAAENDNGWVWKDVDQQKDEIDRSSYRYQVNENLEDFGNDRPVTGYRPQNAGPYGPNGRPIVPASYPGNKEVLVGPGGPTGIIKRPPYTGSIQDGGQDSNFVPPWVREDPRYQEYDTCRCRYSFNCPSSGLKFGTCSRDKKYCCFNSRKYPALVSGQHGERYPPHLGIPSKYGPATFAQSPNYYGNRRPQGSQSGGNGYPGNYHFPGENGNPYPRPRPHGGPYEQNYDYNDFDSYSRSLKKNHTDDAVADRKA